MAPASTLFGSLFLSGLFEGPVQRSPAKFSLVSPRMHAVLQYLILSVSLMNQTVPFLHSSCAVFMPIPFVWQSHGSWRLASYRFPCRWLRLFSSLLIVSFGRPKVQVYSQFTALWFSFSLWLYARIFGIPKLSIVYLLSHFERLPPLGTSPRFQRINQCLPGPPCVLVSWIGLELPPRANSR